MLWHSRSTRGSYGLLMDPLNGVADIENRELRLVSNYGFIEDPVRLIRAARLMARLGWHLDERSQARYETAKAEDYIAALQPPERAYELEELFHEEDALRVVRRLEEEGWLGRLSPVLGVQKANMQELARLRDLQAMLYEQGVVADAAAATFPLLTAKLPAKEAQALKESFPRKGFVKEIDSLEPRAKEFATQLASKQAATPSQAFRLIMETEPVVVLWAAFTSKNATVQAKFKSFSTEWPQNRQKIPHLLLQEMRITSDLPDYDVLLEKLFYALMDGQLETPEAMRAFLEPYSPPAPPPPVSLRRPRAAKAAKKEPRSKSKKKLGLSEAPDGVSNTEGVSETDAKPEVAEQTPAAPRAQAEPNVGENHPPVMAKQVKAPPTKGTRDTAVPAKTAKGNPLAKSAAKSTQAEKGKAAKSSGKGRAQRPENVKKAVSRGGRKAPVAAPARRGGVAKKASKSALRPAAKKSAANTRRPSAGAGKNGTRKISPQHAPSRKSVARPTARPAKKKKTASGVRSGGRR